MKADGFPLWLMLWTIFISTLTLLAVVYGPPEPPQQVTFDNAQWLDSRQENNRPLPARLMPAENDLNLSTFRFHWPPEGSKLAPLRDPVFYAPSVFHLHQLFINGEEQKGIMRYSKLLSDTSRPLLIPLPHSGDLDSTDTLQIDLVLKGSAVMGGYMSRAWIGEKAAFETQYNKRYMATIGFRQFMNYWLLLLGMAMALLWILRKQEVSYGLFVVIIGWQVFSNLTVMVDNSWLPTEWFRIGYLSDLWQSVMLVPFAYSFTRTHSPIPYRWFFALCFVFSFLCALIPSEYFLALEQYLIIPLSCLHLFWSVSLISRAAWRGQHISALVLITLVMATTFAFHDIAIIMGLLQDRSNFLLIYAFLPVLSTICIILIVQFVRSQAQLDNMLVTLQTRLEKREAQLQEAFDREQKIQHQRSITEERQRIVADMHDGLGGQLMSIIANANSSNADKQAISLHARQALTDLRLMILSLDNDNQDLVGLLAAFRERAEAQCESFSIDFQWRATALPEIRSLSPVTSANLLRIMQEALQNALRHSQADQITLSASSQQDDSLLLCMIDNGNGGVQQSSDGRGMLTMRRRAVAIGATLVINSDKSGTVVSLNVPRSSLQGSA